MEIKVDTFDYVSETKSGAYTLRKATPEERAENIRVYKEKREKELLKELRELEMLR